MPRIRMILALFKKDTIVIETTNDTMTVIAPSYSTSSLQTAASMFFQKAYNLN